MELKKEELLAINGGGWRLLAISLAGAITFVTGILDGLFRPLSCH